MADLSNLFPNLPGVRVVTDFDFKKAVSTNTKNTEAVLIIGTARDGPSEPYRLAALAEVYDLYGEMSDATSTRERQLHLVRGVLEASEAGCNDIWCMRIGGINAELSPAYTGAYIKLMAAYAGEKYGNATGTDGIGVLITEDAISFKDINGVVTSLMFQEGTTTFGQLVEAINREGMNIRVKAEIRGSADPYQVIYSERPAFIQVSNSATYNVDIAGGNNVLQFTSIDQDAVVTSITFPGTKGSIYNNNAAPNHYYVMSGLNDVLTMQHSSMAAGVYESLSILDTNENDKLFTGAELATRIQGKLNSNPTLTNNFTVTYTVTYAAANPYEFDIAASAGTISLVAAQSTLAETIGFTADQSGANITSNNPIAYNIMSSINDRFYLMENGQYTRDCVLMPGFYTEAQLVTAIQAAISSAGGSTTVTSNGAGVFTFESSRYGKSSGCQLSAGYADFLRMINFDDSSALTTVAGTGFANFCDAATAKEVADHITASTPKLQALVYTDANRAQYVKIYSSTKGVTGEISTDTNINSPMNITLGITPSTTYIGQAGNLPVTLPNALATTWDFVYMAGGQDQLLLSNDEHLDKLAEAYSNIEDLDGIDYIVPVGAYIREDEFGELDYRHAENLARCCTLRCALGHYTHGIISVEPLAAVSQAAINERVDTLCNWEIELIYKDGYHTTTNTPNIDYQKQNGQMLPKIMNAMVSVIAGPEMVYAQPASGPYICTAEASYAGRITSLPVNKATTEKKIGGIVNTFYSYGKGALNRLVGSRYVCFYKDTQGSIRTVLDVTFDKEGETYDNLMTFRTMALIVNDEAEIFRPYIGEPVTPQNLNSIGSECQRYLDSLKNTGIIKDFEYDLVTPPNASRLAEIFIYQTIIPMDELKVIRLTNKLSNII